jgi:hypothetical protein
MAAMLVSFLLGLIPLTIPIAIVAGVRRIQVNAKAARTTVEPSALVPDSAAEFHRAEFVALKSEVAEHMKSAAANFQYALLASSGIFAWLVAASLGSNRLPISPDWDRHAWLLPLFVSSLFCSLSCAVLFQIGRIAQYLRIIEDTFGARELGWEKFFHERAPTFVPIYIYPDRELTIFWLVAAALPLTKC